MAGFSTSGLGLSAAATGAFAGTATAAAPSTVERPGVLVQGVGGSTALPAAAPADFAGVAPTPLDGPHPQYPTLIQSHVAVLQAIGTPQAVIAQIAADKPQAAFLDRYIQDEIMQNPEGWDAFVGNPSGTARAGLQQLMPGAVPGSTGSVGHVSMPSFGQPIVQPATPQANGEGNLVKGLLIGAAVVGVGVLGWMFLKNRNAAAEPGRQALQHFAVGAGAEGAAAGAGAMGTVQNMGRQLMNAGVDVGDMNLVQRGISLGVLGGGGGAVGGAAAAATAESIMNGMGAANGFINSAGISAMHFDMPISQAINASLADRYMGVLEMATKSGQLADFAATQVAMKQALMGTAGATGAPAGNAALRNLLASAANAIPV